MFSVRNCQCLPKVAVRHLTSHQQWMKVPISPHCFHFLNYSHPHKHKLVHLYFHFSNDKYSDYLSMSLLAFCVFSLETCLFNYFLNLVIFLFLKYKYSSNTWVLDPYQIVLPFCELSLHIIDSILCYTIFFMLMKFNLVFCFLCSRCHI